jgi:hypothetical protein
MVAVASAHVGSTVTTASQAAAHLSVAAVSHNQIVAIARRWVAAVWTRRPGDSPFAWLAAVADITAPDLLAQLRTGRPTFTDEQTIATTVDIDGVYSDAVDPQTATVTCVAHRRTAIGLVDQPCATTVTISVAPDGRLTVSGVG